MRPRLTIIALLATGMLLGGAGTALAFQNFGQSGNDASKAQYPQSTSQPPDAGVRGEEIEQPPQPESGGVTPQERGEQAEVPPPPQVEEQTEVGSPLPFTGFAAIPVLMLGAALVVTGLVLRRPRGD